MGKGFQNFMSKKDFHPSAWWNLKRVWEARELKSQKEKREEEMRVQYEKEQEMLNNKALLGDEKAKMGLSFMYDAPAGMGKKEEPKEEPKFEWQRKYQAPREEWAKNNELIQDQPFGIQVKNVRCCRCHKWGHINTDNECPLYGMSGNFEDAGYANNPSDLIKEYRKEKANMGPNAEKRDRLDDEEWIDKTQLAEDMKEMHGMRLKGHVLTGIHEDQQLSSLKGPVSEADEMKVFLQNMTDKEKKKLMKKLMGGGGPDGDKGKKKSKKEKRKEKKARRKEKKEKKEKHMKSDSHSRVKREVESSDSSDSEGSSTEESSPPPVKRERRDSYSDSRSNTHRTSERDNGASHRERDHVERAGRRRVRQDSNSSVEPTSSSRRSRTRSPVKRDGKDRRRDRDEDSYDRRKVKQEPASSDDDKSPKRRDSRSPRRVRHSSSRRDERRTEDRRRPGDDEKTREHSGRRGSRERKESPDNRRDGHGGRDRHRSRSPRRDRDRCRRSRS